jgi:hypothetical protein
MASVGEGLGDDEGGEQRRRQQRDHPEQRRGSERPPMTSGPRPFSAIVQAPTTAIRIQARITTAPRPPNAAGR